MERLVFLFAPQLLLVGFGALLGVWGILLRRLDPGLETVVVRLGWIAAGLLTIWIAAATLLQGQLPLLNPGQLAFFLAGLVWLGYCYAQRRVDQRLFAVLPLLGVVGLMIVGLVWGLRPDEPVAALLGVEVALHVSLSLAGVALLLGCGVYATGHVILARQIRRRRFDTWFQRLPSLDDLDRLRRLTLTAGAVLIAATVVSATVWTVVRPSDDPTVTSHQHPMLLLLALLTVLLVADRRRWWSAHRLAVGCVIMSALVLVLLCISVVEIFQGRAA